MSDRVKKTARALAATWLPLFLFCLPASRAAGFPDHTVTIVVPYPPGGSADMIGRLIANKLSLSLGQTVIVENKGGASGAIGAEHVARAKPDGYTLLVGISDTHAINPALNQNLAYRPIEDFAPISLLAVQPFMLCVGPSLNAADFKAFADKAKGEPGKITYASNGVGGLQHLAMEFLARQAGIDVTHVPYKGAGPALADVVGGHVDAIFISLQGGRGNIDAGQLRPLAATSADRIPAIPSVPTFKEAGYPDFQVQQFYAFFAPAKTPPEIIRLLNRHVTEAIRSPDIADEKLGANGTIAVGGSPEKLGEFLKEELAKWIKVGKEGNIQLQ